MRDADGAGGVIRDGSCTEVERWGLNMFVRIALLLLHSSGDRCRSSRR